MLLLRLVVPALMLLPGLSHAQVTEFKLTASDGSSGDLFGRAVAISDSFVIIGSPEDDDAGPSTGSAYIYSRGGSTWGGEVKLNPSVPGANDGFGTAVALTNSYAVIGEPFDGPERGEVHVFERNGPDWNQVVSLTASDASFSDNFGYSVAIDGTTIVVGAFGDDQSRGAAYVFELDDGSWVEQAKLTANDAATSDYFGIDVAISGDRILVGARWNDEVAENAGAGYIFRRENSVWTEEAKLTAEDGGFSLHLGGTVSLSGETAILGASGDDHAGLSTGSAYIFTMSGDSWVQEAKLIASDANMADFFGIDVSIDGTVALVGASADDDLGISSGSVYLFRSEGGGWLEADKWTASDGETSDHFGETVLLNEGFAVVGAPDAFGGPDPGAAYVFTGFSAELPCDEIDFFAARCNASGAIQSIVKLFNSTAFAGETVTFLVDGSFHSELLLTNGTHSIARLQIPSAGFGQHSVTLVEPAGCYDPVVFNCQVGRKAVLNEPDMIWAEFDALFARDPSDPLVPEETGLLGNYPNPFNPSTTLRYGLSQPAQVTIKIYNMMGQHVRTVLSGFQVGGFHEVLWDGRNETGSTVASGIYVYRMTAGSIVETRKMLLMK